MMAPYAAGHLKMGYLLEELGHKLSGDERFQFYLTNTLEMEELAHRLNESHKARNLMEAYPRTIQFDLKGEESKFFVTIEKGLMTISKGVSEKADLVIAGDTKEFAKVARGKLDLTHPIARGQITITKGKVSERRS
jgi:putative sterol carrier protein